MVALPIALLAAAQVTPVPVPPPPPRPRSGQLHCELRDQAGEVVRLEGQLGESEPRFEGRRYPQVTFTSDAVPALTGTYEATWTILGGDFLSSSSALSVGLSIRLLSYTFGDQTGAIVAAIRPNYGGEARFFAGFCRSSFSSAPPGSPR